MLAYSRARPRPSRRRRRAKPGRLEQLLAAGPGAASANIPGASGSGVDASPRSISALVGIVAHGLRAGSSQTASATSSARAQHAPHFLGRGLRVDASASGPSGRRPRRRSRSADRSTRARVAANSTFSIPSSRRERGRHPASPRPRRSRPASRPARSARRRGSPCPPGRGELEHTLPVAAGRACSIIHSDTGIPKLADPICALPPARGSALPALEALGPLLVRVRSSSASAPTAGA